MKVVLAEDSAAVAGVLVALTGLTLVRVTHDAVWDGIASMGIGLILAFVAYAIGRDAKRMLIGEAATDDDRRAIEQALSAHPSVLSVSELLTMQVGPEDILVAARSSSSDELSTPSVEGRDGRAAAGRAACSSDGAAGLHRPDAIEREPGEGGRGLRRVTPVAAFRWYALRR